MDKTAKIKLLAKYFNGYPHEDDPDLDRLCYLQDNWTDTYGRSKSKMSFQESAQLANETVLNIVLADDYK